MKKNFWNKRVQFLSVCFFLNVTTDKNGGGIEFEITKSIFHDVMICKNQSNS